MKKTILSVILITSLLPFAFSQNGNTLKVGDKAPDWLLQDADRKEFSMNTWAGKVLQVNYVDPDVSDLNDTFNDAVNKATDIDKTLDKKLFKGMGIVDCKSTWKPNGIIRMIAGNKAKKYNTTILFDYEGTLQKSWGMPKDNYTVVILDKSRIVRYICNGKIPDSEINNLVQMLIKLSNE